MSSTGRLLRPSQDTVEEDVSFGTGHTPIRYFGVMPRDRLRQTYVKLANFKHVSSYSWTTDKHPTIAVPGMPPIWNDPAPGTLLPRDSGKTVIDQNALMTPEWPLLALVASVHAARPDFPFRDINVVTTRNSIRKLIRFVRGAGMPHGCADFCIDVDVVGKTMLLTRREPRVMEFPTHSRSGCAMSFERISTDSSDESFARNMGHHRVVKFGLTGLNVLMRFETDACVLSDEEPARQADSSSVISPDIQVTGDNQSLSGDNQSQSGDNQSLSGDSQSQSGDDLESDLDDNLASLLRGLNMEQSSVVGSVDLESVVVSVSESGDTSGDESDTTIDSRNNSGNPRLGASSYSPIHVIHKGQVIQQKSLVELTTRWVGRRSDYLDELCDQIFLSQTPWAYLGLYDGRAVMQLKRVDKVSYRNHRFHELRKRHMPTYVQMATLLRQVYDFATKAPTATRMSLVCMNGRLGLYPRTSDRRPLPDKYMALFG